MLGSDWEYAIKTFELGLDPRAFNSTTQEGEVEDLCELEFSLVYIEFQNSQGYIERLCLKHTHLACMCTNTHTH